ncbi:MAG: hypothetical protein U0746_19175 [Gemmataceae bacterium]
MTNLSLLTLVVLSATPCAGAALPRSSPERQGVSSSAVRAFVEAADQTVDSFLSFMLVRHGHVIAEGWWAPYAPETPFVVTLRLTFTGDEVKCESETNVGFAATREAPLVGKAN